MTEKKPTANGRGQCERWFCDQLPTPVLVIIGWLYMTALFSVISLVVFWLSGGTFLPTLAQVTFGVSVSAACAGFIVLMFISSMS